MKLNNLLLLSMCAPFAMNAKAPVKPNIIQITVDDLGYADLSFLPFASEDVSTPAIDRLRDSGIYCTQAYASASISSPSRTGLITGRYQQRWGNYWFGEGGLPSTETTLPEILRENGYYTIKIGKTHHNGGDAEHPLKHGFDHFFGFVNDTHDYLRLSQKDVEAYGEKHADEASIGPLERNGKSVSFEGRYTTDLFTEEAIDCMSKHQDEPFYLQLDYNAVHHPIYVNHPDYLERFGLEQFPFWNPEECTFRQWHDMWGKLEKIDPDGRKRYLSTLACLDDNISRLLDWLKENDMVKNTVIILMSDNGGSINTYSCNGPLRCFKKTLFDGGIRIPMLISYPGHIKAGKEYKHMVSALDIMPTVLEYAGIEAPDNLDGVSLVRRLAGKDKSDAHDALVFDDGINYAVHADGWKLLNMKKIRPSFVKEGHFFEYYRIVDGKCERSERYECPMGVQLYHIDEDMSENVNLAEKYPEKVAELEKIYREWRSEMAEPFRTPKPKKK